MDKLIVIIIVFVSQNLVIGKIEIKSEDGVDLFNNLVRDLYENCGTELGTIGYWAKNENFRLPNEIIDAVVINRNVTNEIIAHRRIRFFAMIVDKIAGYTTIYRHEKNPAFKIKTMFVFDKDNSCEKINLFRRYQIWFENCKVYHCSMSKIRENTINIVTLNSFTDYAPPFWFKVDDIYFNDNHGHWRLFLGQYSKKFGFNLNGSNICDNIIFDRTKYLNGYAVKVLRSSFDDQDENGRVDELITKDTDYSYVLEKLGKWMGNIGLWLIEALNISLNITFVSSQNKEQLSNMIEDVLFRNNSVDLALIPTRWISNEKRITIFNNYHLTYPILFFHDVIVTHNRGLMTPLEKMFNFYGLLTIIATTIILLMAFIVIYLSNRMKNSSRLSFAIFECLRLLINNSIYTRMDTAKMRIFFFVIFLYFLIMQATFSGHLAAFLTKPEYRKNVETLDDLKDPRYTVIYANHGCKDYITDPLLLNKIIFGERNCHIDINESIACIDDNYRLSDLVIKYKLHVPENSVSFGFSSLTMRHNWPLNDRVNSVVMRIHQSSIFNRVVKSLEEIKYRRYEVIEDKSTHNYYRPVEIQDVNFAFILLAIGLVLSSVSFILELLSEFIKSTYNKIWKAIVIIIRIGIFQFQQLLENFNPMFI